MTPVSIYIPSYNGERHIAHAVQSALDQTWKDLEVVVCDDASTDGTMRILESISDPRLRLVRNPLRLGLPRNFNRMLELSRGTWLKLLGQDDILSPRHVEQSLATLWKHPSAGVSFSNFSYIDAAGRPLPRLWPNLRKGGLLPGRRFLLRLAAGNIICLSSTFVHRKCFDRIGRFREDMGLTLDWDMWARLAVEFDFVYLEEKLTFCRMHDQQVTASYLNSGAVIREEEKAIRSILATARRAGADWKSAQRNAVGCLFGHVASLAFNMLRRGKPTLCLFYLMEYLRLIPEQLLLAPASLAISLVGQLWRTVMRASLARDFGGT